jgi:alpha-beta hydrolase superfamily lysophospholipase
MTEKIFNYKNSAELITPQEFSFTSTNNLALYAIKWIPPTDPTAVIVLVHGIAEHSGRYEHVAQVLVDAGFAVYTYDHSAHGKSAGEPRTYFTSFDLPLADLTTFVDMVIKENPAKKIFVYGHSMGSLISCLYVLKNQTKVAGWISSGSPLAVETSLPKPAVAILLAIASLLPTTRLIKIDPKALTHDENIVQAYLTDPLVDSKPARLGMVAHIVRNSRVVKGQLGNLRLPILLLHGGLDTVCPPAASPLIHEKAGATDKTLKVYEGLFHEIHNETHFGRIMTDMVEWISGRC